MMANAQKIPFLDLITPHQALESELLAVVKECMRTAGFVGGPFVEQFEKEFAAFCDTEYCVGLASGTDAVRFALMAAGVQPGDAVLTVPYTFIATTEAISQAGAQPLFVDIDPATYCMDPQRLLEFLRSECYYDEQRAKTFHRRLNLPVSAVVPVHLYGHMAEMDAILETARQYNLVVIEDACQAHGAEYFSKKAGRWCKAGSMGAAAAFSFYPGKNLGACGEAGAVTTSSLDIVQKVRMLRDHGQINKYQHEMEGYNGRLDAIQAGFLSVKLKHLAEWNTERRRAAHLYDQMLAGVPGVTRPVESGGSRAVYHLYVIRVQNRESLQRSLAQAGIETSIHYPVPLHLQKAYSGLGYSRGDFPVSESVASEVLSLPLYPRLTLEQQQRVVEAVRAFENPQPAASRREPEISGAARSTSPLATD